MGLIWTQRVATVFMVLQPKEEASQHAEKTGSGFPMGLCRSPFGSQITAQGCERAAQHISFSGNSCSCFARAWGRWGQARGRKKASNCGDRNEEAQSVGQLQPQHSLGSVLETAWQGKGCPSSTLALLSSGPSPRAGSMGPGPSAWNLLPLGPGEVLSCPSKPGHITPQMNAEPFPWLFPLLWRSVKEDVVRWGGFSLLPQRTHMSLDTHFN